MRPNKVILASNSIIGNKVERGMDKAREEESERELPSQVHTLTHAHCLTHTVKKISPKQMAHKHTNIIFLPTYQDLCKLLQQKRHSLHFFDKKWNFIFFIKLFKFSILQRAISIFHRWRDRGLSCRVDKTFIEKKSLKI